MISLGQGQGVNGQPISLAANSFTLNSLRPWLSMETPCSCPGWPLCSPGKPFSLLVSSSAWISIPLGPLYLIFLGATRHGNSTQQFLASLWPVSKVTIAHVLQYFCFLFPLHGFEAVSLSGAQDVLDLTVIRAALEFKETFPSFPRAATPSPTSPFPRRRYPFPGRTVSSGFLRINHAFLIQTRVAEVLRCASLLLSWIFSPTPEQRAPLQLPHPACGHQPSSSHWSVSHVTPLAHPALHPSPSCYLMAFISFCKSFY